jgi:SAM-dependent methyltransferase
MPLNASRVRLDRFAHSAADSLPADALVLDAGAGDGAYRHHFDHARYESADFLAVDKPYAPDITYVGDLAALEVDDARFDLVLLTQVLEHLPEPLAVLTEMRRVLRSGGRIWASTPLFYEEHEQPYDFFRYTQFSLDRLFTQAGFHDVRIEWLEGYMATVAYELDVAARAVRGRAALPLRAALKVGRDLCTRSDLRHKRVDVGHPKNYTIVAVA